MRWAWRPRRASGFTSRWGLPDFPGIGLTWRAGPVKAGLQDFRAGANAFRAKQETTNGETDDDQDSSELDR